MDEETFWTGGPLPQEERQAIEEVLATEDFDEALGSVPGRAGKTRRSRPARCEQVISGLGR